MAKPEFEQLADLSSSSTYRTTIPDTHGTASAEGSARDDASADASMDGTELHDDAGADASMDCTKLHDNGSANGFLDSGTRADLDNRNTL